MNNTTEIIYTAIARATHMQEARSVRRERLADMLEGGGRTLIRATATEEAIRDAIEVEEEMLRPEGEVLMDLRPPRVRQLFEFAGELRDTPLSDDSDPLFDDSMSDAELAELVPHEPVWNLFTLRNRVS